MLANKYRCEEDIPSQTNSKAPSNDSEKESVSPQLKSKRLNGNTASTNSSSKDVLESVLLVRSAKRSYNSTENEKQGRPLPFSISTPEDAHLGKRLNAYLSMLYLNGKYEKINNDHADTEDLINSHFEDRKQRLLQIRERLSSEPRHT